MNNSPGHGADFPSTEPLPLEPQVRDLSELSLELAPVGGSEDDLLREARKDGRVCPLPTRWLEFHRVLLNAAPQAPLAPQPVTGSAWAATPPSAKRDVFAEQIAWATQHRVVQQAFDFLSSLPREEWYYGD